MVYSWTVSALLAALIYEIFVRPSLLTGAGVLVTSGFLLPVKYSYENFGELEEKVTEKVGEKKVEIAVTAVLFLLSWVSFTRGVVFPLSGTLNLSFHASAQIFLPARTLFSGLHPGLGNFFFNLGRWLLQLMYIYLVTGLVSDLVDSFVNFTSRLFR
jgi:hypothetical protein